ncbi:aminoglycoside phosphotransferase family protein [Kallotenue papyrolyticum]|uniref:aminoglycoside phosphotransferase family protein n=1 Tax=Kallotenue papyrolyticum TaxID=1325125 RepID=UPI0004785A6B|nr:aminoglycoside phosphotransferase family protein [Kallotenue papyrolyticum]
MLPDLPPTFVRAVTGAFGAAGHAWLTRLPVLLPHYAERWSLRLGAPFALAYNYVVAATRADGTPAVLKLGVPTAELIAEIAALRCFAGHGAARLLAADPDGGALLLERLLPGTPLAHLDDDEQATLHAIVVMRRLWRPLPAEHAFATLAHWTRALRRATPNMLAGKLPPSLLERAQRLCDELLRMQASPVLLHGDLHHHNILRATRAPWLAIDPKGLAGEPAFEVGPLLYNRLPPLRDATAVRRCLARRVELLAQGLPLDRERILAWGLVQAALSLVWSITDNADWQPAAACCMALAELQQRGQP